MSDALPPMSADEPAVDYDAILRANAKRVFGEADPVSRLAALKELWSPDGQLIEPDHVYAGIEAISESIGVLLTSLPPGTSFNPLDPAAGHHGLGCLRWQAQDGSGATLPVSGTDVALIENGRIIRLYTLFKQLGTIN